MRTLTAKRVTGWPVKDIVCSLYAHCILKKVSLKPFTCVWNTLLSSCCFSIVEAYNDLAPSGWKCEVGSGRRRILLSLWESRNKPWTYWHACRGAQQHVLQAHPKKLSIWWCLFTLSYLKTCFILLNWCLCGFLKFIPKEPRTITTNWQEELFLKFSSILYRALQK